MLKYDLMQDAQYEIFAGVKPVDLVSVKPSYSYLDNKP